MYVSNVCVCMFPLCVVSVYQMYVCACFLYVLYVCVRVFCMCVGQMCVCARFLYVLYVCVHVLCMYVCQVDRAVKKACGALAFINRGIEFKSREVMLQLYRTLVRPHLEYCVWQFWSPHYRKDVEALERVQKEIYQDAAWIGG